MEYKLYILLVISLMLSKEIVGDTSTSTEYMNIAKLSSIESQIDRLKSLISAQDATIARQFTTIANLRADIAGQNAKIAGQTTKIAQQDTIIAGQTTKIAQQDTTIAGQTSKIAQQDTGIAGQTMKIAQQDATIANLRANIAEQNTKIVKQEIGIERLQQNLHSVLQNVSETQTEQENGIMELDTLLRNTTITLDGEDKKLNREFHKIINATRQLNTTLQTLKGRDKGGAVYIRWGHDQCPNSSKLIFSGFAAGNRYSHSGGANTLCLPQNPTLSADKTQYKYYSSVYGAEYELTGLNGESLPKQEFDVPCAVCQSFFGISSLMMSGRDICPDEWHQEYKGQLMAGYSGHKSSTQYVCVDNDMKTISGTEQNKNGRLFYPAIAVCGSLKCPPYQNLQILTCTVCTN